MYIYCSTGSFTAFCPGNQYRLVLNGSLNEGTVEVCVDDRWERLSNCSQELSEDVCSQLGFAGEGMKDLLP